MYRHDHVRAPNLSIKQSVMWSINGSGNRSIYHKRERKRERESQRESQREPDREPDSQTAKQTDRQTERKKERRWLTSWCLLSIISAYISHCCHTTERCHVVVNDSGCHDTAHLQIKRHVLVTYDDVIEWEHFRRYWPFVRWIHRSPVNSPHKGQWHGALMFSLIFAWINRWVNNGEAGDLRRHRAHYDVRVMI